MSHQDDYLVMLTHHRRQASIIRLLGERGTKPADTLRGESLGFARDVCCRLEEEPNETNVLLALDAVRKIEYRLRQLRAGHRLTRLKEGS